MDESRQPGGDRRSDTLIGDAERAPADANADPAPEPLPQSVRQRLDYCAEAWLSECGARGGTRRHNPPPRSATLPWLVAAAAGLLAIVGWWPRLVEPHPGTAVAGSLQQWRAHRARGQLLASAGVGHWAWGGASEMGSGDVVWDGSQQRGFLRLRGFVPNDPARAQYQLWIYDATRDDRHPVDGGVFDVPAGLAEVIIPMHPSLPVGRARAFAITVERPGGVVVSARDKVVAFAPAGT